MNLMFHKYGTFANNFQRFAFIGSMSLSSNQESLIFRESFMSFIKVAKAPESAMKSILFDLMEI